MVAGNILSFGTLSGPGLSAGARLRSLNLTAPDLPQRRFSGVSSRFGAVVAVEASAWPAAPVPQALEGRAPRLRIVRRPAQTCITPPDDQLLEPEPRLMPQEAQFRSATASRAMRPGIERDRSSDRKSGFWFAVVLMVMAWAGIVAVGALFFNTPRSGFKVEWR